MRNFIGSFLFLFTLINPLICLEHNYIGALINNYFRETSVIEIQNVNDRLGVIIKEENMSLLEKDALTEAANNYITTLNQIGQRHSDYQSEDITPLCSKNCKKVRNGKVLFEGKSFFAAQLDAGKEWLGSWSIDVQEVLISTHNRSAVIHYKLATEKEDNLVVIAILHFDSNYLINEINEVHNKFEK